jgi:hypothetical protein
MSVDELAALLNVERPRDLTRRKSDGQGRDGELTRLENAGIIVIDDGYVEKTDNWRQALEIERELKGEIDAEERQREAHCRQRIAYRNRDKTEPEAHPANVEVDGYIGELRTAVAEPEVQIPEPEVSELAAAIRAYLDRNPGDACQPLGWIGTTLWAYELHPGNPTPDEVRTAITELGGGTYIRDTLERARGAA